MPRLSPDQWKEIRRLYEDESVSQAELAKRFDVSTQSIRKHKNQQGWRRKDGSDALSSHTSPPVVVNTPPSVSSAVEMGIDPGPGIDDFPNSITVTEPDPLPDTPDLAYQKVLEDRILELEAELDEVRPTADVSARLFGSPADVRSYYDSQQLRDLAEGELAKLNSERLKRGFLPFEWDEQTWQSKIEEAVLDLLQDRTRHVPTEGRGVRALKMVNPNSGALVQIQVEDQVNNQAGSISDGITKYRNKGFKIADPFLCAMRECWEIAATNARTGAFEWQGYCSEGHMRRTEGAQIAEGLPGVMAAAQR